MVVCFHFTPLHAAIYLSVVKIEQRIGRKLQVNEIIIYVIPLVGSKKGIIKAVHFQIICKLETIKPPAKTLRML